MDKNAIVKRIARERWPSYDLQGPVAKEIACNEVEDILQKAGHFDLLTENDSLHSLCEGYLATLKEKDAEIDQLRERIRKLEAVAQAAREYDEANEQVVSVAKNYLYAGESLEQSGIKDAFKRRTAAWGKLKQALRDLDGGGERD